MKTNPLWSRILRLLPQFRNAFSRHRTFLWFCCLTLATVLRTDLLGVTSLARSLGGKAKIYDCLLGFFASGAVKLEVLTRIWARILSTHKLAVKVNGRILLVVDGIKAPKSGRRMPAVKKLFQHSSSNTKPEYITGHSCQNIAILLGSLTGVFAVPILTRILEGLRFTPKDKKSQIAKLPDLLGDVLGRVPFYLVADAYYASGAFANSLISMSGHLITRAKGNAVAYLPFQKKAGKQKKGRPKQYGKKVSLQTLSKEGSAFVEAESPVYGERGVKILYREVILLWKPVGKRVKFVIVKHPTRGKRGGAFYLMTTDLELDAMDLIYIYGLRFKIEVSFKAAIHSVGAFAYHFWTWSMKKRSRASGDQYVHREPEKNVEKIKMKMNAYHVHLQIGNIAQGMMQILALEMPQHVAALDCHYRRTVCELPTEATVAAALKTSAWIFDGMTDDPEQCVNQMRNAMNLDEQRETGSGGFEIPTGT
jgi:DDE superfamily endonuclease